MLKQPERITFLHELLEFSEYEIAGWIATEYMSCHRYVYDRHQWFTLFSNGGHEPDHNRTDVMSQVASYCAVKGQMLAKLIDHGKVNEEVLEQAVTLVLRLHSAEGVRAVTDLAQLEESVQCSFAQLEELSAERTKNEGTTEGQAS